MRHLPDLPAVGFGCGQIHEIGIKEGCAKLLTHALQQGVSLWDTADVYGEGASEIMLGQFLSQKGVRTKVFLATKGGLGPKGRDGQRVRCGDSDHLQRAIDASLKRLRTDYVDLYYLHRVDPSIPVQESIGALARLRDAGKTRFIGISHPTLRDLQSAIKEGIGAVQTDISLLQLHEVTGGGLYSYISPRFLPVVASRPLAGGLLARPGSKGEQPGCTDSPTFEERLVRRYRDFAREIHLDLKALSLQYLAAKGHIVGIPGTCHPAHLQENVRNLTQPLDSQLVRSVEKIWTQETLLYPKSSPGDVRLQPG